MMCCALCKTETATHSSTTRSVCKNVGSRNREYKKNQIFYFHYLLKEQKGSKFLRMRQNKRSKHIATRWHWVRDLVQNGTISIESCRDPEQSIGDNCRGIYIMVHCRTGTPFLSIIAPYRSFSPV